MACSNTEAGHWLTPRAALRRTHDCDISRILMFDYSGENGAVW